MLLFLVCSNNKCQDDTLATKKYRGVHFGKLKSKRTQFKGTDEQETCHVTAAF